MKTITRKLVRFVKSDDKYNVYIVMQGYEFVDEFAKSGIVDDKLFLGVVEEENIQAVIKFFSTVFYDVQVVDPDKIKETK